MRPIEKVPDECPYLNRKSAWVLDGDNDNGRVTYLAGHDYSVALPITSNPQTNGVRLFLNSLFESGIYNFAG